MAVDEASGILSKLLTKLKKEKSGATAVIVIYDGSGDSGGVEDVYLQMPDNSANRHLPRDIRDLAEDLAYKMLENNFIGWENNDGAYGSVKVDIAARTAHIDHEERIMTTNAYTADIALPKRGRRKSNTS